MKDDFEVPLVTGTIEFLPGAFSSSTSLATIVPDECNARWVESPRPTYDQAPQQHQKTIATRVLGLDSLVKEICNWLAIADKMIEPGGASTAWARNIRERHRIGRNLMLVNRLFQSVVGSDPTFFGRLLVPISLRLPHIALLHGTKTSWLTVDGSRIDDTEKINNDHDDASCLSSDRILHQIQERDHKPQDTESRCSRSRSPPKQRFGLAVESSLATLGITTPRTQGGLDDEEDEDYFLDHASDASSIECTRAQYTTTAASQRQTSGFSQLAPPSRTVSERSEKSEYFIPFSHQGFIASVDQKKKVIPTTASVSLWAALGYLPQLECLELTKCGFIPLRTASPSHVLPEPLLLLRSLCLYKCYGLTADVLADLVALCPNLDTLELHHARPWHRDHRRLHQEHRTWTQRTPSPQAFADDEDDSIAAWIAGVAMAAPNLRTLRLGDGVDDSALEWTAQLSGLQCLNLMHTYAVERLPRSLALILNSCGTTGFRSQRLIALSIHIDGPNQSSDDVAQVIANSPAALSLRVLAIADHVPKTSQAELFNDEPQPQQGGPAPNLDLPFGEDPRSRNATPSDTLTDTGLLAIARGCRVLSRLMLDDARAITAVGAIKLLSQSHNLEQLVLRRCFSPRFNGAQQLYDLAAKKHVQVFWEPCEDQLPFFPRVEKSLE